MIFIKSSPLEENITEACAVIDDILDFFLSGDQKKDFNYYRLAWRGVGGELFI